MNFKLPLIAAFAAAIALTACGGSSSDNQPSTPAAQSPASLAKVEIAVGTGAEAVAGKAVTVHYTGWLYSTTAAGNKGAQFDTSVGKTPLGFTLGTKSVIDGFDQGTLGMKVGGKRTVVIPAALGYGSASQGAIPPNSGLVFDIELLTVK